MGPGNLIDFQPDKELCGGRDISEEQRCHFYDDKTTLHSLYIMDHHHLAFLHLCIIVGDYKAFLGRIVRYTYHRGEFVEDHGKYFDSLYADNIKGHKRCSK